MVYDVGNPICGLPSHRDAHFHRRGNNIRAEFGALFGLWTLRPRSAISVNNLDNMGVVVHENRNALLVLLDYEGRLPGGNLLNILSLVFAVHFYNGQSANE